MQNYNCYQFNFLCMNNLWGLTTMKQEGMTFDHDFCYFILLFSSLLKKEGREKENDVATIVIKSHTFLFHREIFMQASKIWKRIELFSVKPFQTYHLIWPECLQSRATLLYDMDNFLLFDLMLWKCLYLVFFYSWWFN